LRRRNGWSSGSHPRRLRSRLLGFLFCFGGEFCFGFFLRLSQNILANFFSDISRD